MPMVDFVLDGAGGRTIHPLDQEPDGFFSGTVAASAGDRYWFRLDGDRLRPDPALAISTGRSSRSVADRRSPRLQLDRRRLEGGRSSRQVIYEMHVGTYTPRGDVVGRGGAVAGAGRRSASRRGSDADCGFPGQVRMGLRRREPVCADAPVRAGRTISRAFVDRAHALGLGVILDVVYNHLGPGRQLPGGFFEGLLHDEVRERLGRCTEFRRPASSAGALRRERRILDRRIPLRRSAARRDTGDSRRVGRTRPRQHHGTCARGGARTHVFT